MLLLAGLCLCLVVPALTRAAYADTITTFTLTGATGLNTGFGSFTVDTTTGVVQSIDFDFSGRNPYTPKQALSPGDVVNNAAYNWSSVSDVYDTSTGKSYSSVGIALPVSTFIGYTGGLICSTANPCSGGNSVIINTLHSTDFQSGSLTQSSVLVTAPTPEPSSLSYLLLSIVAVASLPFLRRRILQPA